MKKVLMVSLVLLTGLAILAWSPSADAQEGPKMGLSMLGLTSPYYQAMVQAFKAEVEKLGGTAYVTDAQQDMSKQVSDIEDLLQKGIDALILNPKDPIACVPKVKEALEMGVPTFVIDSGIDESAPIISLVQSNNQANGEAVGAWLANKMQGEPIRIALISGNKGSVVGKIRRLSTLSGIIEASLQTQGYADVQVVAQGWTEWDAASGLDVMEDILVAHKGKFNVVLSEADIMNIGAMKALEAEGILDDITIIAAADGQKEAYELIKQGKYGATGLNSPSLVTKTAIDLAVRYLNGERGFPRLNYTPPAAVSAENVDKFYDPDALF
jgi:ribose transport system substrate-binding protein